MTENMTDAERQENGVAADNASKTALLLVAEDDQFYANLYRTKLEKEGFGVVTAANGKETLELLK